MNQLRILESSKRVKNKIRFLNKERILIIINLLILIVIILLKKRKVFQKRE